MTKVAIYARVSTSDKQDYTRQIDELVSVAKKDGYTDKQIDIYAESLSGYTKKAERPQLTAMLDKIEKNNKYYDQIYTSEISRLGRNPSSTRQIIDDLTDKQVPIYIHNLKETTIKSGKRNPIMNIVLQVLMEFANSEAELFKERSKSGLRQYAKKGKWTTINTPYGYRKGKDGYLEIDEEEAKIIRYLFDKYNEGIGSKQLASLLNEKGVPTRMNKTHGNKEVKFKIKKTGDKIKWNDSSIRLMLMNSIYCGKRNWKGEVFESPAIVSEETYEKANNLRQTKTHRNFLVNYDYLLKDLCTCGKCGRNYFPRYKTDEQIYMCSSRLKKNGNCGNVGVNITLLENSIINYFGKHMLFNNFQESEQDEEIKTKLTNEIEVLESQVSTFQTELKSIANRRKRILELFEFGDINKKQYQDRKAEIDKEETGISSKLNLLKSTLVEKKTSLENLLNNKTKIDVFQNGDRNQIRQVFKKYIKSLVIHPIDFNSTKVILTTIGDIQHNIILHTDGLRLKKKKYAYTLLGTSVTKTASKKALRVNIEDKRIEIGSGELSLVSRV